MSEIPVLADPYWIRWLVVGLIGAVSSLIIYIWRSMKKNIDSIIQLIKDNKKKQDLDHDRIDIIETKVKIYHPENGAAPTDLQK